MSAKEGDLLLIVCLFFLDGLRLCYISLLVSFLPFLVFFSPSHFRQTLDNFELVTVSSSRSGSGLGTKLVVLVMSFSLGVFFFFYGSENISKDVKLKMGEKLSRASWQTDKSVVVVASHASIMALSLALCGASKRGRNSPKVWKSLLILWQCQEGWTLFREGQRKCALSRSLSLAPHRRVKL